MPIFEIIKTDNEVTEIIHRILLPIDVKQDKSNNILMQTQNLFISVIEELDNSVSKEQVSKALTNGYYKKDDITIGLNVWQKQEK